MSSGLVAMVRAAYADACPVVLEAVTLHLPPAADISAARAAARAAPPPAAGSPAPAGSSSSTQSQGWAQFQSLLDVGLMILADSGARLCSLVGARADSASVGAAASAQAAAVAGLQRLAGGENLAAGLVKPGVVADVVKAVLAVALNTAAPMHWALSSGTGGRGVAGWAPALSTTLTSISGLLKELAVQLPPSYLSHPLASKAAEPSPAGIAPLALVFLEAVFALTSITTPFQAKPLAVAAPASTSESSSRALGSHPTLSRSRSMALSRSAGGAHGGKNGAAEKLTSQALLGAVAPSPRPELSAVQQGMDTAMVSALVAAQALMRKANPGVCACRCGHQLD
jgi:hypothetical protein